MGTFTTSGNFSTSAGKVSLDPRLASVVEQAAALSPYNVTAISGVANRSAGTTNHPNGWAVDVQLSDPQTGKVIPNYQNGPAFQAYEQFAQTARVVQQEAYPELGQDFRWGGYFGSKTGASGYGAADLMHFDINPKMNGATGLGSWDTGASKALLAAYPGAVTNGGLARNPRIVDQVKTQYAALQSGAPVPPGNIPQVASAYANTSAPVPAVKSAALQAATGLAGMYDTPGAAPAFSGAQQFKTTAKVDPVGAGPGAFSDIAAMFGPAPAAPVAPIPATISPALQAARQPAAPAPAAAAPASVPMSGHSNPRTGVPYTQEQWAQVSANQEHANTSIANTGQAKTDPMLAKIVTGMIGSAAAPAVDAAKNAVTGAASNVAGTVGNFASSIASMFGHSSPPSAPAPVSSPAPASSPSSNQGQLSSSNPGSALADFFGRGSTPTVAAAPTLTGGLSPTERDEARAATTSKSQTTTTVQKLNPAYTAWMNAAPAPSPFSNPGVQGLSPDERQAVNDAAKAKVAAAQTPAPPKYITVKAPVVVKPVPVMPVSKPTLAPPAPTPIAAMYAPNGGIVTQGANGSLNSLTQNSNWWQQATGSGSGSGGGGGGSGLSSRG